MTRDRSTRPPPPPPSAHGLQEAFPQAYSELLKQPNESLRVEFVSSASHWSQLPVLSEPEICIVGRSNVGKSSLINYLAGQKNLARVSATPGRTRLLNLFRVLLPQFFLVDLPGYGFAKVSHEEKSGWTELMSEYFSNRKNLKAFLFLFDVRREPNEEDTALFRWLQEQKLKPILLVTKSEKVHKSKWISQKQQFAAAFGLSADAIVFTSSLSRFGMDGVRKALWGVLAHD